MTRKPSVKSDPFTPKSDHTPLTVVPVKRSVDVILMLNPAKMAHGWIKRIIYSDNMDTKWASELIKLNIVKQ